VALFAQGGRQGFAARDLDRRQPLPELRHRLPVVE
jgi:hypothetical protein